MWTVLCLGWILGIAWMSNGSNISLPFYPLLFLTLFWCCVLQCWLVYVQYALVRICFGVITMLLGFTLGLSYGSQALSVVLSQKVQHSEFLEVVVYIDRINQLKAESKQQRLKVLNYQQNIHTWISHQKILESAKQQDFEIGQYYLITGQVRPIQSYANLGGFDVEKWAIQQGISAQFKIKHIQQLNNNDLSRLGLQHHVRQHNGLWHRLLLNIEHARLDLRLFMQQQPIKHSGLALALLSGDESLLDSKTEKLFQRFGISHLLAISGPHVLVFAAMFCWLFTWLIQRYRPFYYLKYPRQLLVLLPFNLCVLAYCAFVGFEIPAIRTLIVTFTVSVCMMLHVRLSSFKILTISASILLWIDPFSVLSAAFWLSYGACFILLRIYETLSQQELTQHKNWQQRLWLALQLLVESQWKIFLALLPLMIIFFQQLSWIAPLSNLIAIPLIGVLIVPLDIIGAVFFFIFPSLASLVFQLNDLVIGFLLLCLNLLDHIFAPELSRIGLDQLEIIALILALVILFLPRGLLPKVWSLLCLIPFIWPNEQRHRLEFNILDVGQGQAIFIRDAERIMLLDVGGAYNESKFSVGERIILPFLLAKSVEKLDDVWLTHLDQDHSGALPSVMQLPIKRIVSNQRPKDIGQSHFDYCQRGQIEQWSKSLTLQVLSPRSGQLLSAEQEKNESSCVILFMVRIANKEYKILVMGDAGWPTEYQLLQDYPDLTADILVLGHHGSRHSSSYDFIRQVAPKWAVVSVGLDNRYGHPSPQVLARLRHLNIPVLQTSQTGNIRILFDTTGLQLEFYRAQKRWLQRH